jgi:2-iminobutanoate/2-iminopropanoate deaminase
MSTTYGPYSAIRQAGHTYYVSGQIGISRSTGKTAPDAATQTECAILNLETVLRSVNLGLDDVVKTTVFLTSMADFAAMNDVYEQRFATPRPARSTVAVNELPRFGGDVTLLVEIEAIAYKEDV